MLKDREILDSELRDKIELYSELTGQDGWNVPITKVADFISGFEMGKEKFRKKGHWIRMSDLSEQEDDRYKCSYCGNVIHHKNKMNLYTFNSWCGRCGSDNGRKIEEQI